MSYRQDGVVLEILPGAEAGAGPNRTEMILYIRRKEIAGLNLELVSSMIAAATPAKEIIAEAQQETILDEELRIEISPDAMSAYATLLPADDGGAVLNEADMREALLRHKVCSGIDESKITYLSEEMPYYEKLVIACGRVPKTGEDGSVEYFFSAEQSTETTLDATGKIDFRSISRFEKVDEGQVLVRRTFATRGEAGMDVCGKELPGQKGKEAGFPIRGKNVLLSEDKTELISKISGMVSFVSDRVSVLPNVTIAGDVDMSVGNVDFNGDVLIRGNVNQGFTVQCTGNLHIFGSVEAASLICSGDITIEAGIKGADKGTVKAGGNVYALFMERAEVVAGGNIITESLVGCNVLCDGYVNASAGKGKLIGGTVSAGQYIVAKTIGSDTGIQTKLYIGALPQKKQRYAELEREMKNVANNLSRLELTLQRQPEHALGKAKLEVVMAASKLRAELAKMEEEKRALELLIAGTFEGSIHALDKIYKGVRLVFGFEHLVVPYDNDYITYYKEQGQILSMTCKYDSRKTGK